MVLVGPSVVTSASRSTAAKVCAGARCEYRTVIAMVLCPGRSSWTVRKSTPAITRRRNCPAFTLGLGLSSTRGVRTIGGDHFATSASRRGDGKVSFSRHEEIYRPMLEPGQPSMDHPGLHRYDEFPAGYSLVGCAPAEPASASPASTQLASEETGRTIEKQQTVGSVLAACLSRGDKFTDCFRVAALG